MAKKPAQKNVSAKSVAVKDNPGMMMVVTYFILFVVNALTLFFANMFFPADVVIGTHSLSPLWAILLTSGALSLLGTLSLPFFHEIERRTSRTLTSRDWMVGYFFINLGSFYFITRYSQEFGTGVSSWMAVVALAAIFDTLQGAAMMLVEKSK